MSYKEHTVDDPLKQIAALLITFYLSSLAVFSVLTVLAKEFGIPFRLYSVIGWAFTVLFLISFLLYNRPQYKWKKHIAWKAAFLLIMTGVICSTLALISHNCDGDDFYYLPNVVYMLDNPNAPMGHKIHFLDGGPVCEIVSHSWGTSKAFEYMQGAFSTISGIEFLSIYYLLSPTIISFLIPLALYYLLSFFSNNPVSKAIGVFITLGIIFLLGETHHTYGNFSVTRAFQGKTLLLAVGIPFCAGLTLQYLKEPSKNVWLMSLISITALTGASSSALVLLPLLAIVIIIASSLTSKFYNRTIKRSLVYSLSFTFLILYGIYLMFNLRVDLGIHSPVNEEWPRNFAGHWLLMFNTYRPNTFVILILSSIYSLLLLSEKKMKLVIYWISLTVILYLNPVVAPFLIQHLTSPNTYWRLFYLYPFPLVLAITCTYLAEIIKKKNPVFQFLTMALYGLTIILALSSPGFQTIFHSSNHIRFPPGYKIDQQLFDNAQKISAQAPPGTMLAPPGLSGAVPIVSAEHPQIRIREDGVKLWLESCGMPEAFARRRLGASAFVDGEYKYFSDFERFLEIEADILTSIVIHESVLTPPVRQTIEDQGFRFYKKVNPFIILTKQT